MSLAALLAVSLLAPRGAWAHTDPSGRTDTGLGASMRAFRADGITPVGDGTVTDCEMIFYQATLNPQAGAVAFEGGTWSITTPDGAVHDVTPASGIPCIGGTVDDPTMPGGRGNCSPTIDHIDSTLVMYTVNLANLNAFGQVTARTDYINGFSHKGAADTFGANAGIAFPIDVVCSCTGTSLPTCADTTACNGLDVCDSNTKFEIVDATHFRKGTCVPGTPVTCPQCKTCTEPNGTCDADASQVGQPCTGPGAVECQSPVCKADGSCDNAPDANKNSNPCGIDTAGDCVHPGCENGVCAPAHTTDQNDTPCTSAGPDTPGDCQHPCCEAGQCVADAAGCRDQDSTPCTDTGNELCDAGCDAGVCNQDHICQQPSVGCRITAGGVTPDGRTDPDFFGSTRKATFGGQVGAPCGCIGCFDEIDHIQGEWTHVRHRRTGRLHASDYYSLVCACDPGNGEAPTIDQLCNPGDPIPGPEPRKAPANIACFTGIGEFRNEPVAFRVEVEDRGEPGGGKNDDNTSDVYRIFIWVPTGSETPDSLAKAACCLSTPPDIRRADVEDGGNIVTGNIQIHPPLPNTVNGTCPVPSGTCELD